MNKRYILAQKIGDIASRFLGTYDPDSDLSSCMTAMIDEPNEAYEKEFEKFSSEFFYN